MTDVRLSLNSRPQSGQRLVSFVPLSDSCNAANAPSFNHLVGSEDQCRRHIETNPLSGFQVDREHELRRLLDRNVGWPTAVQSLADFVRPEMEIVEIVWRISQTSLWGGFVLP